MRRYWQHALLRACLAREVATAVVSSRREEAFLVGLLQDCGVLLLVHLLGAPYAELYCSGGRSPAAFHEAEQQRFRCDHVQAITAMAEEWRLPEAIAVPLACHHQPTALGPQSSDVDRLCAVSYLAGSVGFQSGPAHLPSDRRLGPYAREQFGLSRSDLRACLRAVGKAYIEAAGLLGDTLPNDGDVTYLLNEAERQLTGTAGRDEDGTGPVAAERDDDDRPRGAPRSTVPDEHGGRAGVTPIADGVRAPPRHPKASHKHALRTGKGRSGRAARRAAVRALAKTLDDPDVRQHAATLVPEQFRAVALRLNRQGVERYANKRKSERKELLAPCALATFVRSSLGVTGENAYVRNISTGGIGILATRPLRRGEPVEVAIISEGAAPLYVAGLVAFCRHIEGPVHEVGVRFMLHGRAPIFSRDPASAVRDHAWLAEALEGDRLGIDD